MGETIRFVLSAVLTVAGLFVLITGMVGVFRFRYVMNRMHAAAVYDTVGALLMLLGVMIGFGWDIATLKLLVCLAFLWLSSPVATHLLARMEITLNDRLEQEMDVQAEEEVRHEKEGN